MGHTLSLTTSIDNLTGTSGDDIFNANLSDGGTPALTLNGLDSVDGGLGMDTLNVDFGASAAVLPATATIKNIETIKVASTAGAANIDVSTIVGVQNVVVANAGGGTSTVTGGENVSVLGGAAATISGVALKTVAVTKAGGAVSVSSDTASKAGAGATLTSVTLSDIAGGAAVLAGTGITDVTVSNQKVALATTVTNAVSTSLNVHVDGAGYSAAGAAVAGVSIAAGAKAAAITVDATGASEIAP